MLSKQILIKSQELKKIKEQRKSKTKRLAQYDKLWMITKNYSFTWEHELLVGVDVVLPSFERPRGQRSQPAELSWLILRLGQLSWRWVDPVSERIDYVSKEGPNWKMGLEKTIDGM